MNEKYIPTIGLEIHAELKTKTKMFCGCKNDPFFKDPNVYVCPICLGLPGTLPVINKQAVIDTILIGQAVGGVTPKITKWDRKHYFYPDLPKGYQISQYDIPLVTGGSLLVNGTQVALTRIHLEEDTGKLIHVPDSSASLVDYNRAGVPLVELVTEPDIKDAKTARAFAEEYQLLLRTLNVASADMEKGELRVEVNISVAPEGQLGTKVEIKNLNSFRSVERSIEYEIKRQTELLEKGEAVVQETRGFDLDRGTTVSQRVKETAADYRYFPEPDLPPVDTTKLTIPGLPLLPSKLRADLMAKGLSDGDADILVKRPQLLDIISQVEAKDSTVLKTVAQMLIQSPEMVEKSIDELIQLAKLTPHQRKLKLSGQEISAGLDDEQITTIIITILEKNPSALAEYKAGKTAVYGFLVGRVMKETKGQADPVKINQLLQQILRN